MRLSSLQLADFRGFKKLDLSFEPAVTVLVGVNGAGKTSVLDAITLMLTHLHAGVSSSEPTTPVANDVRVGASRAQITLTAQLGGPVSWKVVENLPGHPDPQPNYLGELGDAIRAAQASIAAAQPELPLAVYFRTNRNALDVPQRIRTPHAFDSLSAYERLAD